MYEILLLSLSFIFHFLFFLLLTKLKNKTLFHNVDRVISINDFRYPLESVCCSKFENLLDREIKGLETKNWEENALSDSRRIHYLPSFGFRFYQRQFEKDFDRKSLFDGFDEKVFNVISRKW